MWNYVTVYQISSGMSGLPFALIGLAPLVIGLILIAGKWRLHWRRPSWPVSIYCCVFGAFWIYVVGGWVLTNGSNAFKAFQGGQYSVVQGTVEDFHPMPYGGHENECFTVEKQRFCYSDYEIAPGFHNSASHGGPIRAGIHVRIAHSGPTILRLEIRKDEVLTAAELASTEKSAEREYAIRTNSDPFLQQMTTAFLLTSACWVLWWNVQWRRAMRFWVKPPNRQLTVYVFRIFFALCLIGSLNGLAEQVRRHPLTRENIGATLLTALIACAVVAAMTAFAVWSAGRRDRGPSGQ